ncbi:MAG TPA: YgiQ family radical SAM protein, partial [Pseudomonadales bacterium]|nr:YgiQ family radical SAM protein [Pseudomonadales bacterium]
MNSPVRSLYDYPKYWAECYGTAPFLPVSRQEMDALGWDSCDIIIVTGDAYVDHPSFGMAVIGRCLEAQGFRVGIISQPDWRNKDAFQTLGRPNLFFGVTSGNMDSMINHYTADRRIRSDDAYTPAGIAGKRPDRAVTVYAQRCREAYKNVPVIIGGIEGSLRRIAHYDYWSDTVRASVLMDSKADMLLYGNAERALVEISHRLAQGEVLSNINNVRGTAFIPKNLPAGWLEVDSTSLDLPGEVKPHSNPYDVPHVSPEQAQDARQCRTNNTTQPDENQTQALRIVARRTTANQPSYIRLPSYEAVKNDKVLYAHASRILHQETNPYNARPLVQRHGSREVWINPPPLPLSTSELDSVFDLPYQRVPHPSYGDARIPAYEMIRFSVNIMRGC